MSAGRTGQGPVFRLLIGDQAIRFRAEHGERYHYWDLAETWTKMTSLPFAFAFWLIRPEIENAKEIADKLRALRDRNIANIDELALSQSKYLRRSAENITGSIFSLISVNARKPGCVNFIVVVF